MTTTKKSAKQQPHTFAEKRDEIQTLLTQFADTGETYLQRFPFVTSVAQKTGVRPIYLVGASAVVIVSILTNLIRFITTAAGIFYPAWRSFKAIETDDREDDKTWLTYWVVYAFLSFIEMFTDLALTWISGYHVIKLLLLLWMFLPQYKGAQTIYVYIVRPLLVRYEGAVDEQLAKIAANGKQLLADIVDGEKKAL